MFGNIKNVLISILLFYFVYLFLSNYRLICIYKKSFSSVVTSCIIITYSTISHQEIDIGTIYELYSNFSGFTCTCVCMCVYLVICNFITCINLCNHCHSQDIELFHRYKDPSCYLLIATPTTHFIYAQSFVLYYIILGHVPYSSTFFPPILLEQGQELSS